MRSLKMLNLAISTIQEGSTDEGSGCTYRKASLLDREKEKKNDKAAKERNKFKVETDKKM